MQKAALFFLTLFILQSTAVFAQAKKSKPNIIFILADDMGYGDLSCYGQKKFSTPHIDALASNGMKFTQAYAGTAVCAPSRSSLLTGQHTGHTPIRGNVGVKPEGQYPLPDSTVVLPQLLKGAGYTTGCFGKWGLGYPGSSGDPMKKGIDEFFGYNCQTLAHNYYPEFLRHNNEKVLLPENAGSHSVTYAPTLIHQKTLEFIDKNRDAPFALFITTTIPHAEVAAPEEYMQSEIRKHGVEKPFKGVDTTAAGYVKDGKYIGQKNPRAGYAAMIRVLDDHVGAIVKKLKELKLYDNTLIIFTSDNGPSIEGGEDPEYFKSSGGLRGHKRDLYEGGIREPFIASWPGRIKKGSVSNQPIAFWDVWPTLNEIAGIQSSIPTDGLSFLPTLTGKGKQMQHPFFYWEFYEEGGRMAARVGRWKGIRQNLVDGMNGPIELYDLQTDVQEKYNVAAKHPEIVAQMDAIFKREHVPSPVFKFMAKRRVEE